MIPVESETGRTSSFLNVDWQISTSTDAKGDLWWMRALRSKQTPETKDKARVRSRPPRPEQAEAEALRCFSSSKPSPNRTWKVHGCLEEDEDMMSEIKRHGQKIVRPDTGSMA